MSGGSLPSARQTILLNAFALLENIIRPQCQYARLPVAVKPTSIHVLVCTYDGPIYII